MHHLPPGLCSVVWHYQLQLGYWSEHGPGLHVVSVQPMCGPYRVLVKVEQVMNYQLSPLKGSMGGQHAEVLQRLGAVEGNNITWLLWCGAYCQAAKRTPAYLQHLDK
jgi:hypothetical protein